MSSTNKGRNPESFGDAFRQAARESLVKNQHERSSDIVSIAPIQLALAALAIGIYALWNSWLCLIPLGVVLGSCGCVTPRSVGVIVAWAISSSPKRCPSRLQLFEDTQEL